MQLFETFQKLSDASFDFHSNVYTQLKFINIFSQQILLDFFFRSKSYFIILDYFQTSESKTKYQKCLNSVEIFQK